MRLEEMEHREERAAARLHENALVIGFPDSLQQAQQMAARAGLPVAALDLHHFPDGESRIRLPYARIQKRPVVILYCTLADPNSKLIELILAAESARQFGAEQVLLVAPYLCYMRQDKSFHSGEAVSQKTIGKLLAHYFDGVLTIDAHLHRISQLGQAIPLQHAVNLSATVPMAQFIEQRINAKQLERPLLVGPDAESAQWVEAIASRQKLDFVVANKIRHDDRSVSVTLAPRDYSGRHLILVDDVASTGNTLLATVDAVRDHQPASINILVTHALFLDDILTRLSQAGVNAIWSCDSIPHPSNAVPLAGLFASHLPELLADQGQILRDSGS